MGRVVRNKIIVRRDGWSMDIRFLTLLCFSFEFENLFLLNLKSHRLTLYCNIFVSILLKIKSKTAISIKRLMRRLLAKSNVCPSAFITRAVQDIGHSLANNRFGEGSLSSRAHIILLLELGDFRNRRCHKILNHWIILSWKSQVLESLLRISLECIDGWIALGDTRLSHRSMLRFTPQSIERILNCTCYVRLGCSDRNL